MSISAISPTQPKSPIAFPTGEVPTKKDLFKKMPPFLGTDEQPKQLGTKLSINA
jgi:hypothetical protein